MNFIKDYTPLENLYHKIDGKDVLHTTIEFIDEQDYQQRVNILKNLNHVNIVSKFYVNENDDALGVSASFYVKTENRNYTKLDSIATQYNLEVLNYEITKDWSFVSSTPASGFNNTFQLVNHLRSTELFLDVFPDLLVEIIPTLDVTEDDCINDPLNSWAMDPEEEFGINPCGAWEHTMGEGINIGLMDSGVDPDHEDLENWLPGWDAVTQTSPNQITANGSVHGTAMAGIIGATPNNDKGIAGIAPNANLIPISFRMLSGQQTLSSAIAAVNWAIDNDIDVLNMSFWITHESTTLENAIDDALENGRSGKGMILVSGGGNDENTGPIAGTIGNDAAYPGNSNENIYITSSSIRINGKQYWHYWFGNEKLDFLAPGASVETTSFDNNYFEASGTSVATAYVSGIAGLILSVNPEFTRDEVYQIISKTCTKTNTDKDGVVNEDYPYFNNENKPYGTWSYRNGYGLVDATAAVEAAICYAEEQDLAFDLVIKDNLDDLGEEPNTTIDKFWKSKDIWVRNLDDDGDEHQNPEYNINQNPYIYVKVSNFGCSKSQEATLNLHWAKASTSLTWEHNWTGEATMYNPDLGQDVVLGDLVASVEIPQINSGEEEVIKIEWENIPNPNHYHGINDEPWHFCLLARIESEFDPMTFSEGTSVSTNTQNNNNIAWKNLSVINVSPEERYNHGAVVAVQNPRNVRDFYNLNFSPNLLEHGTSIFDEAEVSIVLDDIVFNAWDAGGRQGSNFRLFEKEQKIIATDHNFSLDNIDLDANEIGTIYVGFNFLTPYVTGNNTFEFDVTQENAITKESIGGETYMIYQNERNLFFAEVEDEVEKYKNESISITADDIGENAIYNWYNEDDELVYSGQVFEVNTTNNQKYRLEIIADSDHYKDYGEIDVKVKPFSLNATSPNPTSSALSVNYDAYSATNAHLMLVNSVTGQTTNFQIDPSQDTTSINISNFPVGYYVIVLVCDGEQVDNKIIQKL